MSSEQSRTAEEWTNIGDMHNGKLQYEDALVAFNDALAVDSKYAAAYYGRGWAYFALNKYQLAITNLSQAIGLSPDFKIDIINGYPININMESRELRVLCHLGLKDYQRALFDSNYLFQSIINNYKRSGEKPSFPPFYYLHRGKAYTGLGRYQDGITDFDYAEERLEDPDERHCRYSQAIFYHRGNAYFGKNKYQQAIADYDKALEKLAENRPDDAPPISINDDVDENVLRNKREGAARRLIEVGDAPSDREEIPHEDRPQKRWWQFWK